MHWVANVNWNLRNCSFALTKYTRLDLKRWFLISFAVTKHTYFIFFQEVVPNFFYQDKYFKRWLTSSLRTAFKEICNKLYFTVFTEVVLIFFTIELMYLTGCREAIIDLFNWNKLFTRFKEAVLNFFNFNEFTYLAGFKDQNWTGLIWLNDDVVLSKFRIFQWM